MTVALILAAGKSRRMGAQKLLLPMRGKPLIVHIAEETSRSAVDRVIVITSPDDPAVAEALVPLQGNISFVSNPDPDGDMLSSIRCGVRALPPGCAQFLLVLGDQPGVTAGLIDQLLEVQQKSGKSIVAPMADGRRGHPILISVKHREEILMQHEGIGLRGLLRNHASEIETVSVDDPQALQDIDLPEDYIRLGVSTGQASVESSVPQQQAQ